MKATRVVYGEWLAKAGEKYPDIVVVDADLSASTMTRGFADAYPRRFFNVGSAEQNLVSFSAGLALGGKRVFTSSFAIFETGRAWDQVRNVVAHDKLNVALVASHGGFSCAADGASHQALEDIAIMRVIPNMKVIMPCDPEETVNALNAIMETSGPVYMRLRREKEPNLDKPYSFRLGRGEVMRDGGDVTLVTSGMLVLHCLKAAEMLKEKGLDARVLNIHTIKPLDENILVKAAKETGTIVTVEEHQVIGGLGGAVCEALSENSPAPVYRLGVRDVFGQSSRTMDELLELHGLTPEKIAASAEKVIKKHG
ncbi:MAG: transketolase family protein [Candidatus Bathyarchaeota archaeon]